MSKARSNAWRGARERALRSLEEISEQEDVALVSAAVADPDNPPLDDALATRRRPAIEVAPQIVKRARGQRGAQKTPTKRLVSLRLDRGVLEHFRATGPGWRVRINDLLRAAAKLGKRARG